MGGDATCVRVVSTLAGLVKPEVGMERRVLIKEAWSSSLLLVSWGPVFYVKPIFNDSVCATRCGVHKITPSTFSTNDQHEMIEESYSLAAVDSAEHSLDEESRLVEIVAILVVGSVLSTAAVGLRAFTRLKMLRTFGADDSVMLVAQVSHPIIRSYALRRC